MSIFGNIMSAIVGFAKSVGSAATPGSSTAAGGSAAAPAGAQPMSQVDVEAVLTGLAANGGKVPADLVHG